MTDLKFRGIEFSGVTTYQSWVDLWILNRVLNQLKPEFIVEIGTALGGSALFLSNYAEVHTFDVNKGMKKTNDKIHFHHEDCFKSSTLKNLLADKQRKLLYCDGGNKIKEFNTFAKMLNPNDYVLVHDWNAEISEKDIDITGFRYILKDECEELGSYIRGFTKNE